MILNMAALGLTTYALLTLYSFPTSSSPPDQCSEATKAEVWSSLPDCSPRPTLVSIPLPLDPHVLQVIPSQVVVPRCAGTCHTPQQGMYQRCVPGEAQNSSVPVLYERLGPGSGQVEEVCATVVITTHTDCRCGCPPTECKELQVFQERTCECRCRDRGARGQCLVQYNKEWDENTCSCRCRPEEWKECSTGFSYDGVYSCQCLPGPPLVASTPLLVILGVFIIVLIITCIYFYVTLKRTRDKLQKVANENQAEKLFPFPNSEREF